MSYLTASGCHHLLSSYGKYLLDGTLQGKALELEGQAICYGAIFMEVFEALNMARRKVLTTSDAAATHLAVVKAITKLQIGAPIFFSNHCLGQSVQISRDLPCWPFSCFSMERMMRWVRSWMKNHYRTEANLTINMQENMKMLFATVDREEDVGKACAKAFNLNTVEPESTIYSRTGKPNPYSLAFITEIEQYYTLMTRTRDQIF